MRLVAGRPSELSRNFATMVVVDPRIFFVVVVLFFHFKKEVII